ncbi:MAG: peptidase S8 [Cyanobacteria bacterium NC_groundwater_1444_Ag_S-0.65um_54_12]|nr:peptidase S8 [Cyanobacteria bacterium NC_groundwater_1444_Ag_S-0.65um_54_12]
MMKSQVVLLGGFIIAVAGCGSPQPGLAPTHSNAVDSLEATAVPGQLLVGYRSGNVTKLARRARILGHNPTLEIVLVAPNPGDNLEKLKADLASDPSVSFVEENLLFRLPRPTAAIRQFSGGSSRNKPLIGLGGNDPLLEQQWHHPKINTMQAWRVTKGQGVTVAVVDSGVDLGHPDLRSNLLNGTNTLENNNDPRDDNGHGTHVAGIVASIFSNGIGGVGVAPEVKILPIRALGDAGGSAQSVSTAIQWATDHGTAVINLSLGTTKRSKAIASAIRYALAKGVVVVAAMGNSGDQGNPKQYPASEPGVIAVGALDPQDKVTPWSDYGDWAAVAAPGYGIWSTFPTYEVSLTRFAKEHPDALPPEDKIQLNYAALSGTSQAAPIVSGIAALLRAANPQMSPQQVRDKLMKTAKDLGPVGFDPHYGAGMADAVLALQ